MVPLVRFTKRGRTSQLASTAASATQRHTYTHRQTRTQFIWPNPSRHVHTHGRSISRSHTHTSTSSLKARPPAAVSVTQIVSCSLERLNKTKRQTKPPGRARQRKYLCLILWSFCLCLILSSLASQNGTFSQSLDPTLGEGVFNTRRVQTVLPCTYCHLLVLSKTHHPSYEFNVIVLCCMFFLRFTSWPQLDTRIIECLLNLYTKAAVKR